MLLCANSLLCPFFDREIQQSVTEAMVNGIADKILEELATVQGKLVSAGQDSGQCAKARLAQIGVLYAAIPFLGLLSSVLM